VLLFAVNRSRTQGQGCELSANRSAVFILGFKEDGARGGHRWLFNLEGFRVWPGELREEPNKKPLSRSHIHTYTLELRLCLCVSCLAHPILYQQQQVTRSSTPPPDSHQSLESIAVISQQRHDGCSPAGHWLELRQHGQKPI
jgi:hypothetical protein